MDVKFVFILLFIDFKFIIIIEDECFDIKYEFYLVMVGLIFYGIIIFCFDIF